MFSYDWNFDRIWHFSDAFAGGVVQTLWLSLATIIFATILGVGWGILLARGGAIATVTQPISYVLRGLPPLVLVLFGYYFYTQDVIGFTLGGFAVFVFSVGFNIAAFIADITRSALSNTSAEYIELGRAMGFSEREMLQRIVAPVAFREMVAPLSYLYVETIKVTYLASVISVHETVYIAQSVITESSRSLEVWVIVAAIYIVCVLPLMAAARLLERHAKLSVGLPAL
jgi:His/Glu/Gln/Arg/opine family amino acid ABC transporter permease subunit